MAIKKNAPASSFEKYGLDWPSTVNPLAIEIDMIRDGGQWTDEGGRVIGKGLLYHFKEAVRICWPEIKWHKWNNLIVENYLMYRTIVIIGPASSGKTHSAAFCLLMDYYAFPSSTTGIVCSTTKERLEDRIWGEIKKLHKLARSRFNWIPGHMIEGRMRIVTDNRADKDEARDFRNGIVGVACKKGNDYVGLGEFAGLKNKRVRLIGDELSLLPRVFVHAISNLDKNPDFKAVGLGNPKETTDALGAMGEPAAELGGWDSGIDQTPKTKTWATRRPQGIAIQLPGTDSPNIDGTLGIPLINQKDIDRDVAFYGKESQWFTMMDQGMMPRGQGSRRVITRQLCLKHQAMEDPNWASTNRTYIAFLDAAYRGVGGDRCVFGVACFGAEAFTTNEDMIAEAIVAQRPEAPDRRQIFALIETMVVPIKANDFTNPAEDQIVDFVRKQCDQRGIPPNNFYFDSGMRTSLVTAFSRMWSTAVNSIDCGGTASERMVSAEIPVMCKDYYSKKITEFWYSVRLCIEANQFRGMTEEVMLEGCQREFTRTDGNKIEVEPKEKMKLKTGRSPDLFDALAIGLEGARQKGFRIRKLVSPNQVQQDTRWKDDIRKKATKWNTTGSLNYSV